MSEEPPKPATFEVIGPVLEPECQMAVDAAYGALAEKLSPLQMQLLRHFKIRFFKLDESKEKDENSHGSHVDFKNSEIVCNRDDAKMSLQQSDDYLVEQGVIEPGDNTSLLPYMKDQPWSTLINELVHEYGHVLDKNSGGSAYNRLEPKFSPTKYGSKEPHEAFAEAFRFYIFDAADRLAPEAKAAVEEIIKPSQGGQ